MAISKEELGNRLKIAREQAGFKQEEAAQELGVSRGALAQLEGGMRPPNSLQLATLAELYGREVGEFLRADFEEGRRDALAALFRADAGLAEDHVRAKAVRECAVLCREHTNLEALLGFDKDRVYPVAYPLPPVRNRWDAIRQGERLAELERGRLKLGESPIRDMMEILEPQGLRLVEISLPENISGIFLNDPQLGLSIIINADHHLRRRIFSYAHEYCHVLADRDRTSLVSKAENREELPEVRANAFAATFLMPESGVRAFVQAMGKGEPSRSVLQAYDEAQAVVGQKRMEAHSQDLQVYDVVHVAHHFGVSYETALYRLLNLKLLSEEEHQRLAGQREQANILQRYLGPEPQRSSKERREFCHRFLFLALEAFRREAISRGKLKELCALAQVASDEIDDLIAAIEREAKPDRRERAVSIPRD
ncbi:Helix-turn-helix domain protein [Candidatus Methylomirabilis lanthanidiphila]|uniref:Helix-turn-helix domain protein n=1 Tax=Candidatus Methylomirabilis lanthanidiphila TaxID=2211376 RepID=A0A564ZJH6_9BACT|nr:Helix-turn-helix domain protein [Candidatus Methylomirabilis lanthanidiphila]